MSPERLDLLFVSLFPPSPPTFGAQRRIEGLMRVLAGRHRVTGVSLVSPEFDARAAERAMRAYCRDVVLVPSRPGRGSGKRLLQLRSLASPRSFEHHQWAVPALQRTLDDVLRRRPFHLVSVEAPFLLQYRLRQAPPGRPPPRVLLDEHNVEHDLARRSKDASRGLLRRLHYTLNWRKIRSEELAAWRRADGVAFTSTNDADRARALFPQIRAAVIPNGVDVAYFQPHSDLPVDPGKVVFFGTLDYFPNQDGVRYLLGEIWPRLAPSTREARLEIIGPHPTAEVLAQQGPRIEVAGYVDDLRPHLARAGVVVVPLRVGGGTRFKILEAMAMGKPVVSTTIGAEGIGAVDGREILIADEPEGFAAAVRRLIEDRDLARRLGQAGRALVERRYSWHAIGASVERFIRELLDGAGAPAREVVAAAGAGSGATGGPAAQRASRSGIA